MVKAELFHKNLNDKIDIRHPKISYLIDKIKDSYYVTDNIYIRKENINNKEFIDNLKQYDKLVNETYDKNIIVNAEKQILSRYEELVIRNE